MTYYLRSGLAALVVATMGGGVASAIAPQKTTGDRSIPIAVVLEKAGGGHFKEASSFQKQSRLTQCNRLSAVLDRGRQTLERFNTREVSVESMNGIADALTQLARQVMQVRMADTNLQGYRNGFVRTYGNMSRAARQVAVSLREVQRIQQLDPSQRDLSELQRIQTATNQAAELNSQASTEEKRLVNAFNSYCRAGR